MKQVFLSFSVVVMVFICGCTTIQKENKRHPSKPGLFRSGAWNPLPLTELKISKTPVNRAEIENYKLWLAAVKNEVFDLVASRMIFESYRADAYTRRNIGLGSVSTTSSIAAAVLTTASSANSAWVTGLSGLAGGISANQTAREANGFSREAVSAVQSQAQAEIAKRMGRFDEAYQKILAFRQEDFIVSDEMEGEDLFNEKQRVSEKLVSLGSYQASAEMALVEMYLVSVSPMIAVGGDDSISAHAKLQTKMLQLFENFIDEIPAGSLDVDPEG